jgi:hypothetical protein
MTKLALMFATAVMAAGLFSAAGARAEINDCAGSGVIGFIDHRFDDKARRYLGADLDILAIGAIDQTHVQLRDDTHPVQRVYCHAKADMSDGHRRDLWYMIESNMGFVGLGDRIRFCIAGLDPWHVDGRQCRSVR